MKESVMLRFTPSTVTRREFLVRSAATTAGTFMSIGLPVLGNVTAKADAMSGFTPSIWFTLTPDGKVTMHIVKAEMGQHVGTGLAQIIAEELEVKWDDVRLDSPLESVENFAIYGLAYTVNSGSITTEFDRLSRAGAAGRMALIEAGAKVLGTNEADCPAATPLSANRFRLSTSRPRPTARRSTASMCSCRIWSMARLLYRARATAPRC